MKLVMGQRGRLSISGESAYLDIQVHFIFVGLVAENKSYNISSVKGNSYVR